MIKQLTLKDKSIETSGITKDYKEALCEYIWNGFEANATEIAISYTVNDLGGVDTVVVKDNGDGIAYDELDDTFGTFLASNKNSLSLKAKSKSNKGKGRFSFISFATNAKWITTYKDKNGYWQYSIELTNENKEYINYTEKNKCQASKTGTTTIFTNIFELLPEQLTLEILEETLLKEFAWYLFLNKNKKYKICLYGSELNYKKHIDTDLSCNILATISNIEFDINLIVWKDKISEKFCSYYFDKNDVMKGKDTTTFNRNTVNFNHSVYVKSDFFNHLYDVTLERFSDQTEMNISIDDERTLKELKTYIQKFIEEKLKAYMSNKADKEIDKMINHRKTFPHFSDDPYDQLKKQDLITVTKELYCLESRIFYKLKDVQERSLLGFLKLLLNSEERENILTIIEDIVELSPEQRKNFADILKRTKLKNVIETINFVKSRYEIIEILKTLVYDLNKYTNERDNIQKIVEQHYWLLGEQYNLASADRTMQKALEKYTNILYGATSPNNKLSEDEEQSRRMDIFLCSARKTEMSFDNLIEENIIVELKAPKVSLSKKVLRQIEDYMDFVYKQPQFNSIHRRWKFIAVCKCVDEDVKLRYKSVEDKGKPGLVLQVDNYEVYAFTWDDIFKSFDLRHSFILEKLNYDREHLLKELVKHDIVPNKQNVKELTEIAAT